MGLKSKNVYIQTSYETPYNLANFGFAGELNDFLELISLFSKVMHLFEINFENEAQEGKLSQPKSKSN